MSSSPFALGNEPGGNRPRDGSISLMQHSTPTSAAGAFSIKSPFNVSMQKGGQSNAASPARVLLTASGSGFSPGLSQNSMPSPATFANMAAAVGVQNPLEEVNGRGSGSGGGKAQDPFTDLLSNTDNFLNVQLSQLEAAGNAFFDLYEGALSEDADPSMIVDAHRTVLAHYDHLLFTATQIGLAALPCPSSDRHTALRASSIDEVHSKLVEETKETFERRDRLREGASMVTSILTHDQWRKPT